MQILTINNESLATAYAVALEKAAKTSWENVLTKAVILLQKSQYIGYDDNWVYIPSQRGGDIYRVDRAHCQLCQCEAHSFGSKPCTHRAAARLVVRLLELEPQSEVLEMPIAQPVPVYSDDLSDLFS